jgi:hypothetical protein
LQIKNLFRTVSNREKILIYAAGMLLLAFVVYQFVFSPLLRARMEYDLQWVELENRVGDIEVIARRYASEKSYLDRIVKTLEKKKSISVLTFLENVAEEVGIKDNIEYIKPKGNETGDGISKTVVELKIDAISIIDLMRFLYRIEEERNGLLVSYLRVKPYFKDKSKSDVIFRIADVNIE